MFSESKSDIMPFIPKRLILGTFLNKTFLENFNLKVSFSLIKTSGTKLTVILNLV